MKICVDVRSPGRTGVLSYARSLLNSMLKIDNKNEYILITDYKYGSWNFDNVKELTVPSLNPAYWIAWSNIVLPKLLEQHGVDIYHTFKHVTAFRLHTKKIVTLHGLHSHYILPEVYKWYDTLYWKLVYTKASKCYDRLITVADAEKRYLVDKLGFPDNKFNVTYLGADERFKVIEDKESLQKIKDQFNLPDHFILYVGQIHPRKNLEGVFKAYYNVRHNLKRSSKLVIVGKKTGSYYQEMSNLVQKLGIKNDIMFLGHVNQELPHIYNLADLFLLPSHYEGFGIVLAEAMACGLPVITSDITDILEVVGDAAIIVNPKNIDEITEAIKRILNSDELRHTLSKKSIERSKLFSWDRCARETINIYEDVY